MTTKKIVLLKYFFSFCFSFMKIAKSIKKKELSKREKISKKSIIPLNAQGEAINWFVKIIIKLRLTKAEIECLNKIEIACPRLSKKMPYINKKIKAVHTCAQSKLIKTEAYNGVKRLIKSKIKRMIVSEISFEKII